MSKKELIDPALGHLNGRHLATLEALDLNIAHGGWNIIGGRNEPENLNKFVRNQNVDFSPVFSQPFYKLSLMSSKGSILEHVMVVPAREYGEAIRLSECSSFRYHTLSWEHAEALAVALQYCWNCNVAPSAEHIVLAMFNPGISHDGSIINSLEFVRYRFAFRQLLNNSSINLFVPCREYG